jgi:hypothetical protein
MTDETRLIEILREALDQEHAHVLELRAIIADLTEQLNRGNQ